MKTSEQPIIAVDFDGTLCEHKYPEIGAEVPMAFHVLKTMQKSDDGVKLILYTMRSGKELNEAVQWCKDRGLEFWAINNNPEQSWSTSRKIYANIYIDDAAIGVPLLRNGSSRPFVNWFQVGEILLSGIYVEPIHAKK